MWLDRSVMPAAVSGLGVVLDEVLATDELRDGRLIAPTDHTFEVETRSYVLVRPRRVTRGALTLVAPRFASERPNATTPTSRLGPPPSNGFPEVAAGAGHASAPRSSVFRDIGAWPS